MKNIYSISELARFFGISAQTLRHYDKIGLLKPSFCKESNKYRLYGREEIHKLYLIKELKKMGLSLEDIKAYCETKNLTFLEKLLRENNALLSKKIEHLNQIKTSTEEYLKKIERTHLHYGESCYYRQLPERSAYLVNLEFRIRDLETYVDILNASFMAQREQEDSPGRSKILLTMSGSNLEQCRYTIYNGIGYFYSRKFKGAHSWTFPAGLYAVTYHFGAYDTIHKAYKRLHADVIEKGFSIAGDAVEVSIVDTAFTDSPQKFITEIQIPVEHYTGDKVSMR